LPSPTYTAVAKDLEAVVGDILAAGIIKTGLRKVGADPDSATPDVMKRAIDAHIGQAIESFMGVERARLWVIKTKGSLEKKPNNGGR
jgi:hypothetical protein